MKSVGNNIWSLSMAPPVVHSFISVRVPSQGALQRNPVEKHTVTVHEAPHGQKAWFPKEII
jgi:hypothetical protein